MDTLIKGELPRRQAAGVCLEGWSWENSEQGAAGEVEKGLSVDLDASPSCWLPAMKRKGGKYWGEAL